VRTPRFKGRGRTRIRGAVYRGEGERGQRFFRHVAHVTRGFASFRLIDVAIVGRAGDERRLHSARLFPRDKPRVHCRQLQVAVPVMGARGHVPCEHAFKGTLPRAGNSRHYRRRGKHAGNSRDKGTS